MDSLANNREACC